MVNKMNIEKKEIKRKARGLGFFVMSHQLVFQFGATVMLIVIGYVSAMLGLEHLEDTALYIASDLMQLIAGVFFLVFYLVKRKKIKSVPMMKSKCTSKLFVKCLITIFSVNMILSLIEMLLTVFTGFSLSVPMKGIENMNPILLFATVAVFPAIVEELMFRGVLYRYLREHGVQFAAISSSIIFGLVHLNFLQFIFATIMGVVCCYIYEATGKLRYSMLLHLLNNSILVLFNILPITGAVSAFVQIALGVMSLVAVIAYLVYRKKKHGTPKTDISVDTKKSCLYLFTSIPMLIFVLACLGVCVYMSFC